MLNSEVSRRIRPPEDLRRYKTVRRYSIRYFGVIFVLFILIIMLCINNLMIFKSYRELQQQVDVAAKKIESVTEERDRLFKENKVLKSENIKIRQDNERIIQQNEKILNELYSIRRINDELVRKNKELVEDNIALQNSLKIAASAGIKPQNYTKFNGLSSRGEIERGKYIGKFLGTAYTPSKEECGNNKGITNSGKPIIPGISIAVDTRYWPFGTVFYIKGLGYAVAMDTGSAIKGKYRFDFSVFDKNFARKLGSRKWDVYLVKLGRGYVEDEIRF